MKKKNFYRELVQRYKSGTASDSELEVFFHLMQRGELDSLLEESFEKELPTSAISIRKIKWIRYAAAVLVFGLLGIGSWYYQMDSGKQMNKTVAVHEILPASNRAMLNLADGRQISLDSSDGILRINAGAINDEKGHLVYAEGQQTKMLYHEVTVPRGAKFQLQLSDGSLVWLNSESRLKFPVTFNSDGRDVELVGEGFFEIAKIKNKAGERVPFTVRTERQHVEVLGTTFNVAAYANSTDERATLFTGSVRIQDNREKKQQVLNPGQEAIFQSGKTGFRIATADLEAVSSWKDGVFMFSETPIEEVLRQLSLWYDVTVEYHGDKNYAFNGYIERDVPIAKVLNLIKQTGDFNVSINGRKISVNQL